MSINIPKRLNNRWEIILHKFGDRCGRCGKTYPRVVYDLHHPNGKSSRKDTPSKVIRMATDTEFLRHLETWELLCANCHRLHHAAVGNWHPAVKIRDRGPCAICGETIFSDAPKIRSHDGACRKEYERQLIKAWKRRKRGELSANL